MDFQHAKVKFPAGKYEQSARENRSQLFRYLSVFSAPSCSIHLHFSALRQADLTERRKKPREKRCSPRGWQKWVAQNNSKHQTIQMREVFFPGVAISFDKRLSAATGYLRASFNFKIDG